MVDIFINRNQEKETKRLIAIDNAFMALCARITTITNVAMTYKKVKRSHDYGTDYYGRIYPKGSWIILTDPISINFTIDGISCTISQFPILSYDSTFLELLKELTKAFYPNRAESNLRVDIYVEC